jgi:hypothetical protein
MERGGGAGGGGVSCQNRVLRALLQCQGQPGGGGGEAVVLAGVDRCTCLTRGVAMTAAATMVDNKCSRQ